MIIISANVTNSIVSILKINSYLIKKNVTGQEKIKFINLIINTACRILCLLFFFYFITSATLNARTHHSLFYENNVRLRG